MNVNVPKIESNGFRRYGDWAGNPQGSKEDKTRCVCAVWLRGGLHSFQCARRRGYGPDGEYCKQHARKVEAQKGGAK